MSDESTSDDTTPGDATSDAPVLDTDTTQQVPVSDPAPTETSVPAPEASANAGAKNAGSGERRGVFVPRWLAIVAGVVAAILLVGGGGFALGRSTADDDDSSVATAPVPNPDRGDTPSTPSRPSTPDLPDTPARGSAYLGVSVDPTSTANGVEITDVADGSPAADAGLEAGDVITEIDGESVSSFADLAEVIADHEPGDDVEITYERDGESDTLTVTLGERPTISSRPEDSGSGNDSSAD
jgi:membrane-associated protease RseP (regulator of RpoE activity)